MWSINSVLFKLLFSTFLCIPIVANGEITLGIETKIWPFMWVGGKSLESSNIEPHQILKWKYAEKNLDSYAELGGKLNIVDVYQELDGPDKFKRLKQIVDQHESRGIEVVVRLYEDIKIYNNLRETISADYGYNYEYFLWTRSLASTFKDRIKYYLISNEADLNLADRFYDKRRQDEIYVSHEQYRKLLNTAYMAIKGVSKELKVIDHGISNYSLGLAVASDIYNENGLEKAFEFWKEFQFGRDREEVNQNTIRRLLNKGEVKRRAEFARATFMTPGNSDYIQLHHYRSWKSLPTLLEWISNRMKEGGTKRPIFAAEVGYRLIGKHSNERSGEKTWVADWDRYSESEHAEFLVKNFSILLCAGTEKIIYWIHRWHHGKDTIGRLFQATQDPQILLPYKAAKAYRYLAHVANGQSANVAPKLKAIGLWGCTLTGDGDVSISWTNGSPVEIEMEKLDGVSKVTDMYGQPIVIEAEQKLKITSQPIYLFHSKE